MGKLGLFSQYFVHYSIIIVFMNVHTLSAGIPRNLKSQDSSSNTNNDENRSRNCRSTTAIEPLPDFFYAHVKSILKFLQQLDLSEYTCHLDGHQGGEAGDDLSVPKLEMKKHVFKTKNSKVNVTNVTTDSPVNEKNSEYYRKIIDTVLITLHVAPALFIEIYTCLQQSPVFHTAMKSIYNKDTPARNVTASVTPK